MWPTYQTPTVEAHNHRPLARGHVLGDQHVRPDAMLADFFVVSLDDGEIGEFFVDGCAGDG